MFTNDRHTKIVEILNEKSFATIEELSTKVFASPTTIRRDLSVLENQGVLKRIWGGAIIISGNNRDTPIFIRSKLNLMEKDKISKIALQFISSSTTLLLDSSSSCSLLAEKLGVFTNLTIITNGLETLNILNNIVNSKVISCGGNLRSNFEFTGQMTLENIKRYHADIMFFSCSGLSADSQITEKDELNAAVKQQMHKCSKKRILFCDNSKFDKVFFCHSFNIEDIDYIITDSKPQNDHLVRVLGNKLIYN